MRRMDRYQEQNNISSSRMNKNQELYQNFSNHSIYTNMTDVANANAYDLTKTSESTHTTREAYQQMQKYHGVEDVPKEKKELEDIKYVYQTRGNKIYDINSVLEEARKSRGEEDVLDQKRKLKNKAYNILTNKEALERYKEEKKKRIITPEEEEMRELIDTIASKTLAGEIDKATSVDLLSDLMATSALDEVASMVEEEISKEITIEEILPEDMDQETKQEITNSLALSKEILDLPKNEKTEEIVKDPDFYTKSMDLSDRDFDLGEELKEKGLPLVVKIILFILIVAVIAITTYFIHQRIL